MNEETQGYLQKSGIGYSWPGWRSRYFVLKPKSLEQFWDLKQSTRGHSEASIPLDSIKRVGFSTKWGSGILFSKDQYFEIETFSGVLHYFYANTPGEAQLWITALQQHLNPSSEPFLEPKPNLPPPQPEANDEENVPLSDQLSDSQHEFLSSIKPNTIRSLTKNRSSPSGKRPPTRKNK